MHRYRIDTVDCGDGNEAVRIGRSFADELERLYAGHDVAVIPPCPCPPGAPRTEKDHGHGLLENCNVHRAYADSSYYDGAISIRADSASSLLAATALDSAYLELHTTNVRGACVTVTVNVSVNNGATILSKSFLLNCDGGVAWGGGGGDQNGTRDKDRGRAGLLAADTVITATLRVDLAAIKSTLLGLNPMDELRFTVRSGTAGSGVEFVSGIIGEDTRPALVLIGTFTRPDLSDYTLAFEHDDANRTSTERAKVDDRRTSINRWSAALGNVRRTSATHYLGGDARVMRSTTPVSEWYGTRTDSVSTAYTGTGLGVWMRDAELDTARTAYDAAGRPLRVTNADGTTSRMAYLVGTPATFGVADQDFHGFVSVAVATDENGVVAARYSDAFGQMRREIADTAGLRLTTRYEYDLQGRLTSVVNPKGDTTRYWYDAFGAVMAKRQVDLGLVSYTYDMMGNARFSQTQEQANADRLSFTQYDDLNRPTIIGEAVLGANPFNEDTVAAAFALGGGSGGGGGSSSPAGRRTMTLDPNRLHTGVESILTANRTLWMTPAVAVPAVPALSEVMTCPLILPDTALGEQTAPVGPFIRRPAQYWGAPVPPADTNSFENIAAHPEFVRIAVAYDTLPPAQGAVWGAFPSFAQWSALAPRGVLRYQRGREAATAYRERGSEPFHYVVMSYDERGRVEALLRYTENLGFDAVYYTYNATNQVVSVRSADMMRQHTSWYGFDAQGRIDSVWTRLSAAGLGLKAVNGLLYPAPQAKPDTADIVYRYTKTGMLDTMLYPPVNVVVSYDYNHRKWLDSLVATKSGIKLFREILAYDPTGQITQQTWQQGTNAKRTQRYTYDPMQRLTRWTNGPQTGGFTDTTRYTYDGVGNRLTTTATAAPAATYTYTAGTDRLATHRQTPTLGNAVERYYTYNGNGSVIAREKYEQQAGGWVWKGREEIGYSFRELARRYRAVTPGAGGGGPTITDWRYRYGAGGEREQKREYPAVWGDTDMVYAWQYYLLGANREQLAVYHGQQTLNLYCADSVRRVWMYPWEYITNGVGWNGVPEQISNVVTKPNGAKEYQVSDHLASLRVAVEAGATRAVDYDPWGNALAGDPVTGERQTFNCQERDRENGLFDLSDRNLDPLTGRFLKCDRLWESDPGLTPYHYAANNPVGMTDPTGLQARVLNEALHVDQGGGSSSGSSGARMGNAIGRVVGNALDKAAMSLASAALFPICPACPTIDLAMNPKATVKAYAEMGGNLVGANGAEAAATEWLSLGIQAAVLGGATRISGVRAAPVTAEVSAEVPASVPRSKIGATGKLGEAELAKLGGKPNVGFYTELGWRFIDRLVNGIGHESKVGRTSLTSFVKRQIAKDVELVQTGAMRHAVYHFFRSPVTGKIGPTPALKAALEAAKFGIVIHD